MLQVLRKNGPSLNQCMICHEQKSDAEIMCSGNHYYCGECINQSYEFKIINKELLTNKCTLCSNSFYENKLEAILSEDVKYALMKYNVFKEFSIPKNLSLLKCPCCTDSLNPGYILIDKFDHVQFYKCEHEKCLKEVCLYCYNEVGNNRVKHEDCKRYFEVLLYLEKVIEYAVIKQCPKCKSRIANEMDSPRIKDATCTHIRCTKCNMHYCYICGGHEDTIDKSHTTGKIPIYRHNDDWDKNANRCPMYVRDFFKVIPSWPNDETEATIKLEKYKILSFMNKVIAKFSFDKVKRTYEAFGDNRLALLPKEFVEKDDIYKNFKKFEIIENKIFSTIKF